MQTNNKMAVVPVGKLIWQMSLPPLISMFLQYSYNLIDSAFVARLSENALTAVSLSFPITTLMNAASIWIGVGDISGALYHLLDGDMHHIGDLHERTYAHIGNAQLIDFFIIGKCPKVGFHNQQ